MKKSLIIYALLLASSFALAQRFPPGALVSSKRAASGGGGAPPTGDLLSEDCEGTGTPAAFSDTGSPDWDYATSPAPLIGSQSVRVNAAGGAVLSKGSFTSGGTRYGFMKVRPVTIDTGSNRDLVNFWNGLFSQEFRVRILTDGKLQIIHGSANASTVDSLVAGNTYNVWFYYKADPGGSTGEAYVGFAADSDYSRPTSGNKFVSLVNGTDAANVSYLVIGHDGVVTHEYIFDSLRVSSTAW